MALVRDIRDVAADLAHASPRADEEHPPDQIRLLRTLIELRNLSGRLEGRPRFGKSMSASVPLFEQILNFDFCFLGEDEASEVASGLRPVVEGFRWQRAPVADGVEFAEFSEPA